MGASLLNRTDCNWNLHEGQLPGHARAAHSSGYDFISVEAPALIPWTWNGVNWPERGFTVTVLGLLEQWYSVVHHVSLLSKQGADPAVGLALERHELTVGDGDPACRRSQRLVHAAPYMGGHSQHADALLGPLDTALAQISDSRMLVLITGFHDASLCLAAVAAGNFGGAARARCACTATRRPIAHTRMRVEETRRPPKRQRSHDLDANTEITG